MCRLQDLTGQKFGRLTVLKRVGSAKGYRPAWLCKCDCGNEKVVTSGAMKSGNTVSCGCFLKERTLQTHTTHGMSKTRTYKCWFYMIKRCTKPKSKDYSSYGGRGIRVCDHWLRSFERFLEDMGECPENGSIDRIDNNGNYTPENCRWASQQQQCNNRRNSVRLSYQEECLTVAQWAERLQIGYTTLMGRLKRGWTVERTLSTPVKTSPRWHK